jgi:catechol 2,3-dioxygenase-like lactoylglutathione lyase family enzyme
VATVRYLVLDVELAVRFYRDTLGFTVVEDHAPAITILRRDDLTLWVAGPTASAARPMPDGSKPVPGGWNRFVLEVEDIEDMVAKVRAAGARFKNDIVKGPGGSQILVEDPSGNVVEIFQPASR